MLTEITLNAFLALARTGSFQEAARQIGVSNASLSRYIAQAEADTGLALFHRSRANSSLTREGREFLEVALVLKADLDRYQKRVTELRDAGCGTLRIGCGPLTPRTLILPALQQVRRQIPDLRFEVLVSAYGRPLDLLQSGEFDLFVGDLTYTPDADNVEIMVMAKQSVVFLAHTAHAIHDLGPCTLPDLFEYPFASPHLHKHWKATLIKAMGGGSAAVEKVSALPQIESDDYSFLTALLDQPEFIVGGMRATFSERLALGSAREVPLCAPLAWNICASRRSDDRFVALDVFWDTLSAMNAAPG